jgi:hypothetical protein
MSTSRKVPALSLITGFCLVGSMLVRQAAGAIRIDPVEDIGVGTQSFLVAIMNDLHVGDSNGIINLRVAVDSINDRHAANDSVLFVMVNGDLTNGSDTTAGGQYDSAIAALKDLDAPFVPLMGNHEVVYQWGGSEADTVGPAPDSMFVTRSYHQEMDSWYVKLAAGNSAPIESLVRDTTHYWNYAAAGWGGLHGYDIFQNFAFKAGPAGSPYRFLCLDGNTRWHAIETPWPGFGMSQKDWEMYSHTGTMPNGELHDFRFADKASSMHVMPVNTLTNWSLRICKDTGFGSPDTYYGSMGECSFNLTPTFNDSVRSIEFLDNIGSVSLYDDSGCTGDVRLDLDSSDRDLSVNGPAQWWQRYINDHQSTGPAGNDKIIIFNHEPPVVVPGTWYGDQVMGFPHDSIIELPGWTIEYPMGNTLDRLSGLLDGFRDEIGGWFSGHITPGFYGDSILGEPIGITIPEATQFKHGSDVICSRWIVPPNGGSDAKDGCVKFVRFWYDGLPIVDCDASGIVPNVVDYTKDDSVALEIHVINYGQLTAGIYQNGVLLRTMVRDAAVYPSQTLLIPWDCRDSLGNLLDPGNYIVKYSGGTAYMGCSPFVIKGTKVHGAVSGIWDPIGSPYVLTGGTTVSESHTLRIRPGVSVMPLGRIPGT